jgi:hypothetical protein
MPVDPNNFKTWAEYQKALSEEEDRQKLAEAQMRERQRNKDYMDRQRAKENLEKEYRSCPYEVRITEKDIDEEVRRQKDEEDIDYL